MLLSNSKSVECVSLDAMACFREILLSRLFGLRSIIGWVMCAFLVTVGTRLDAGLNMEEIEQVYGPSYEKITTVPGRPWVSEQWRYQVDGMVISCNFVDERCLWIDFFVRGEKLGEDEVFEEIERLFPSEEWEPKLFHGKPRWWFNQSEDRVTLRASGFTIHMNEYIRNLLSRREQWQF